MSMMGVFTWQTLSVVWLGAFLGALATGCAGFAFGIAASSVWLHVIDPLYVTFLIVACGTLLQGVFTWPMRKSINPSRLWPFVVGGLIGIPMGVWLVANTDVRSLKFALGIFLCVYGIYALATPKLPYVGRGGRTADGAIGLASGVLSGIGGYSGVLSTIWTQLRGWSRDDARGVYQPFIFVMHVGTLLFLGVLASDQKGLILLAVALTALPFGGWVGWKLYGHLDDRRFRQVLAAMLVASGIALVM